jgi:hypothetical protein
MVLYRCGCVTRVRLMMRMAAMRAVASDDDDDDDGRVLFPTSQLDAPMMALINIAIAPE